MNQWNERKKQRTNCNLLIKIYFCCFHCKHQREWMNCCCCICVSTLSSCSYSKEYFTHKKPTKRYRFITTHTNYNLFASKLHLNIWNFLCILFVSVYQNVLLCVTATLLFCCCCILCSFFSFRCWVFHLAGVFFIC